MKNLPNKLRINPLWKGTYELVEFMYGKIDEVIDNFPDEKWTTATIRALEVLHNYPIAFGEP